MKTGATLFSGFDGVGIGMKAAGIIHRWGIEWRDDVANVARRNGFHSITADILTVDPHNVERVDFLHASPPCTNASVANAKAGESEGDKALAYKTAQFVEVLRPTVFTLENVWKYRNFESFKFVLTTLERLGYWIDVQHVNAADFGVPQTRRRMILRARLNGWIPNLPDPVRWVGWYEAIEDLIPTLPESKFAPWQLERLPDEYKSYLIGNGTRSAPVDRDDPADTITANHNQATTRAFLVNTREAHGVGKFGVRQAVEPAETCAATTQQERYRAFLINGQNAGRSLTIKETDDPSFVVTSNAVEKGIPRAHVSGCVVSMTTRALARFQSFPDWYELPEKKSLACYGIGNAVPPLMTEIILGQLKGVE